MDFKFKYLSLSLSLSLSAEANMLYLESPAGVGFSYSANESFYVSVDDNITGFSLTISFRMMQTYLAAK